jgi:hypothetical protein
MLISAGKPERLIQLNNSQISDLKSEFQSIILDASEFFATMEKVIRRKRAVIEEALRINNQKLAETGETRPPFIQRQQDWELLEEQHRDIGRQVLSRLTDFSPRLMEAVEASPLLQQDEEDIKGFMRSMAEALRFKVVTNMPDARGVSHKNKFSVDASEAYRAFSKSAERVRESMNLISLSPRQSGVVFISCGQYQDGEKRLGLAIKKLIEELTPYEGYFAEDQSSLNGLVTNILDRLYNCVGFICVMHPRGTVTDDVGFTSVRASVWIEQEIAMIAMIQQFVRKDKDYLKVAAYSHVSIKREGIRTLLHLNPLEFENDEFILADLRRKLPTWQLNQPMSASRNL